VVTNANYLDEFEMVVGTRFIRVRGDGRA